MARTVVVVVAVVAVVVVVVVVVGELAAAVMAVHKIICSRLLSLFNYLLRYFHLKKFNQKKKSVVPRGFPLARFSFARFWGQGWVASLPHGVFFAWLFCLWIMRMGFLRVVLLPGASFLGGHVPGCRILRAREELSTA